MMRIISWVRISSYLAVAAILLLWSLYAHAQQKDNFGKEFYVAFAENQGGDESENTFELYITSEVAANGVVEIPSLGFKQTFTTTPGQIKTIDLPNGNGFNGTVEITQAEQVLPNYGIHITADNEIAVYGLNHKLFSTDAFLAIPVDVLGTEYLTINYPSSSNGLGGGNTPGEFWIVSPFDGTNVTITPKDNTSGGSGPASPIQVRMNKGDVYLVQGMAFDVSNDLTGSLIESDLPIAVFSGHVRAAIPKDFRNRNSSTTSRDHLVEQLAPVSAWGDSALVVPYRSSSLPDLVRVVSGEDENVITVNGNQVATLNKGEFYEIKQLSKPTSINATNPIMVGQYMHTSIYGTGGGGGQPYGDPAYAVLFPVEQFHTSYTFISVPLPAYQGGNFVNVVADASSVNNIVLDGKTLPSNLFAPIPNSGFYYAQLSLDDKKLTPNAQGTHNISGPKPFGITVYGLGPVDSYSYPGGTLLKTITPFKTTGLLIDFGDRLLQNPDPLKSGEYTDTFDSIVSLQNISSDSLTITGFPTRTLDDTCFWVSSPTTDLTIGPGESKSIKVTFKPFAPDVRRHTILNAKTEHLRAYVVDVYGRGILGNPQVFSDSIIKKHIDTLDFGTFENTDLPKDSMVYIANKSVVDLQIVNATLQNYQGPNAGTAEFSITSFDTLRQPIVLPFTLPITSKTPARMNVRFTPTGAPNGYRQETIDIAPNSGGHRQVVLVARVLTIEKPSIQMVNGFDSVLMCTEQDRTITIGNKNDFDIKVTDLTLGGADPSDFVILTPQAPFTVPAKGSRDIIVRFSPTKTGPASATITLHSNLPKGFEYIQDITAIGSQLTASFTSSAHLRALPNQDVIVPIYAHSPMEAFKSSTFKLVLTYDPAHLEDYDYDQYNTHTAYGFYYVLGDTAGYREYDYQTLDGSIVTGGVTGDSIPVLYIKFHTHLNEGDDPATFFKQYPINYAFNFDRSPYPTGCADVIQEAGLVTLDSTCADPGLLFPRTDPNDANVEGITPNPSSHGWMSMTVDVSKEGPVRLDVLDNLGNVVNTLVNESKKPGYYDIRWNTSAVKNGAYFLSLHSAGGNKIRHVVVLH